MDFLEIDENQAIILVALIFYIIVIQSHKKRRSKQLT
jgi:hypothetical protein